MWSMRLWRSVIALTVIVVLSSVLLIKVTSQNQVWESVSSEGLSHKMQTTLEQIYWQWQSEGRPNEIMYVKNAKNSPVALTVNTEGVPIFDQSEQGCTELFQLFIGETFPFDRLKVNISILPKQALPPTNDGLKKLRYSSSMDDIKSSERSHLCKFEYADRTYFFDFNTGKLTIY